MNFRVKKCLSGSTLKWIAILTMLIDHLGASLLEVFVLDGCGNSPLAGAGLDFMYWYRIDMVLRLIGRLAFPLFCFLLAEGAFYTSNLEKYMARIGAFALISELPFNLAIRNSLFYLGSQNVFFTLFLGLCGIWIVKNLGQNVWKQMAGFALVGVLAQVCHVDYGPVGVLVIILMYLLRDKPWRRFLACYSLLVLFSLVEFPCVLSFALMAFYNGQRGRQPKYFFYAFYPAHLLLLWTVGAWLLPVWLGSFGVTFFVT